MSTSCLFDLSDAVLSAILFTCRGLSVGFVRNVQGGVQSKCWSLSQALELALEFAFDIYQDRSWHSFLPLHFAFKAVGHSFNDLTRRSLALNAGQICI